MKDYLKYPIKMIILAVCLVLIAYFTIKIYWELSPKSYRDQQLNCLGLGSDYARRRCLKIIDETQKNPNIESLKKKEGEKNLIDKFYPRQ